MPNDVVCPVWQPESDAMKRPEECDDLTVLRALIDEIDGELVRLLAMRQTCIDRAAVLKQRDGTPARIPGRVKEVISNAARLARRHGLDEDTAEAVWKLLVERAIAREQTAFERSEGNEP